CQALGGTRIVGDFPVRRADCRAGQDRAAARLSLRRACASLRGPKRRNAALRRGARAVDRGGLENRCALYGVPWVRIPPSPPFSSYPAEVKGFTRIKVSC